LSQFTRLPDRSVPGMTYDVFGGTLSLTQSINHLTDRRTDRQTDRRRDTILIARPRVHSMRSALDYDHCFTFPMFCFVSKPEHVNGDWSG